MPKNKPIAVLISDIHFNLKTRELAAKALSMALLHAESLRVPLVIAGDLHDTKAMLRGECIATIIGILSIAEVPVFVLIGNHDKIHEKSDEHALEFLRPYVTLVDEPAFIKQVGAYFIPYQHDQAKLRDLIGSLRGKVPKGQLLIMHQGFLGAHMGEYTKDESSIDPEEVKDFRVISGHYHRHQHLGTVTYIGTPYTTSFAEANDGPKGFQVLFDNGELEQVPTNLRKHVVVERTVDEVMDPIPDLNENDLLWLKVYGSSIDLDKLSKKDIGQKHLGHQNFKLDKISTDVAETALDVSKFTDEELLDHVIDNSQEPAEQKEYLKALWRGLFE